MNLNNLENLKEELKNLGFDDSIARQMEEKMKLDVAVFNLYDRRDIPKGQVDMTLHFKQSSQSDYYYLNRYEATLTRGKGLEEGQKYMVITPGEGGKNMVKKMETVSEAIGFFKEQQGNSELAVGKDAAHKSQLALMENGKINYVQKDFQRTFYAPPQSQTFYVDRGKGFTAEQAVNLMQGRAVYRDNLLNVGGMPYKAWVSLDTDKPRDRNGNLVTRQFHDPSYGFNLKEALQQYNIKELDDPKKAEKLEESIRNGNRPLITTVKDGQEIKLQVEATVRYNRINFFDENGKPEKREQFEKNVGQQRAVEQNTAKTKEKEQEQGMGVGR